MHKSLEITGEYFAALEMTFKPLTNFITDSLSKEMIKLEQNKSPIQFTQNIEKIYGTANVGEEIIRFLEYNGYKFILAKGGSHHNIRKW